MKPRFACADFTFPLLSHDSSLDVIAMLGFEGVDVGLFEDRSHLRPSAEFRNVRRSGRKLAKRLKDRGLKPADIFLIPDPDFQRLAANDPNKKIRNKARLLFLQTLEYAAASGCQHVSALPGAPFSSESKAASFARSCSEMAWRLEKAKEFEITFSIEPHLGSIVPTPVQVLRLLDQVPGLTLTLDYTHFTKQGFPDKEVEPLLATASHFHARGGRKNKLQAAVKENVIDYRRIAAQMKKMNYRGYICLEYVWQNWEGCNRVDNLSETILLRDLIRKEFE